MIQYKGLDLFSSGPSTIERGPSINPDADLAATLSEVESQALAPGYAPRVITQRGVLIADTPVELEALIDAIDAEVDQGAQTLAEGALNTWNGCVLRNFIHKSRTRIGPRYAVSYTVTYLQTQA